MNSQTDVFGQETSLRSEEALKSWNATLLAFMAHGATTPVHLGRTLECEPEFALGHAVKGMFYLLLGRKELVQGAREALVAAQTSMRTNTISSRETRFVDALSVWLGGSPTGAIERMEQVLATCPGDTLAMKIGHAIRFVLGDAAGMRASIEAVHHAYDYDHPGRGYLLGCHSFSLEETGEYSRADSAGRMALAIAPDDAWGLHSVAHVYDMTGNAQGGLDWLRGRESAWSHCNNFRYHVWWHKALMHLDLGEIDEVFSLYDQKIRNDQTDDYRDISNATSLLSRLELNGVNVGNRWEELADLSENRTEDGCLIFADLHYLLALIGGDRNAAVHSMVGRMYRDANRRATEMDVRVANPGLAAAAGLEAFGEGEFRTAFLNLSQARQSMSLAGGSHAQRDVFERLTIDAAIRSGHLDEAEIILNDRTRKRAGCEDHYAAARHDLIAAGRDAGPGTASQVPAE